MKNQLFVILACAIICAVAVIATVQLAPEIIPVRPLYYELKLSQAQQLVNKFQGENVLLSDDNDRLTESAEKLTQQLTESRNCEVKRQLLKNELRVYQELFSNCEKQKGFVIEDIAGCRLYFSYQNLNFLNGNFICVDTQSEL